MEDEMMGMEDEEMEDEEMMTMMTRTKKPKKA